MLITCPRCFATYNAPAAAFAQGERMVRCSSCHFEWKESPPPAEAIAALAPELEVAPDPAPAAPVPPAPAAPPAPVAAAVSRPAVSPAVSTPAAAAKPKASLMLPGSAMAWAVFVIATLLCLLVLLRVPIGQRFTAMADFYETIGLAIEGPDDWFKFSGVSLEKGEVNGQTVFTVHGRITNQSRRDRDLPRLKLFWLSARGSIGPMVVLEAHDRRLAVGATTDFDGQLKGVNASAGGQVKVTFLSEQEDRVLKTGTVADPAYRPPAAHQAPASSPPAPEDSHAAPTPQSAAQSASQPAPEPAAESSTGHPAEPAAAEPHPNAGAATEQAAPAQH